MCLVVVTKYIMFIYILYKNRLDHKFFYFVVVLNSNYHQHTPVFGTLVLSKNSDDKN